MDERLDEILRVVRQLPSFRKATSKALRTQDDADVLAGELLELVRVLDHIEVEEPNLTVPTARTNLAQELVIVERQLRGVEAGWWEFVSSRPVDLADSSDFLRKVLHALVQVRRLLRLFQAGPTREDQS